ncbi:MAG TPA: methyltransferase domain-containing protein [Gemmatimonadaceae bacterium]|nr:methyltransferase domain-containing protein [Gemmatimonadaceae bacterium]
MRTHEIADRLALERELERAWIFHSRRLKHPVPPGYLTDRVVFSQDPPVRLVECLECGHVYRNPRESAVALHSIYVNDSSDSELYESLFEHQHGFFRHRTRTIRKLIGGVNRGLEIGSYVGGFLAAARDEGMVFTGLDVNEQVVDFCNRKGLSAALGSLDEQTDFGEYDAVAIWNTFEQLADVRAAATAARRLLRDGGCLALRFPNASFYTRWRRKLDGLLGPVAERFLAHNNMLGFPYRQGFTERSLRRLLSDARFEIRVVRGDMLVSVADRWTSKTGAFDEWLTKTIQRFTERAWRAPWIEVYAVAL